MKAVQVKTTMPKRLKAMNKTIELLRNSCEKHLSTIEQMEQKHRGELGKAFQIIREWEMRFNKFSARYDVTEAQYEKIKKQRDNYYFEVRKWESIYNDLMNRLVAKKARQNVGNHRHRRNTEDNITASQNLIRKSNSKRGGSRSDVLPTIVP